ncbi:MAG: alpha/beta hydrolase, partial [Acidimicrobiales bacterium]
MLEALVRERGLTLSVEHWPERGRARGPAVVMLHGFGGHVGRWRQVAHLLAGAGRPVWAMDFRGHGHSQGRRADTGRLRLLLGDIDGLLALASPPGVGLGADPGGSGPGGSGPGGSGPGGSGPGGSGPPGKPVLLGHS